MAKILIYQFTDNIVEISYGNWEAQQHSYFFNTETHEVEHTQFTTTGGDPREFEGAPYVFPEDLSKPFFWDCADTTKLEYFHDGTGIVTVLQTPDSTDCGWYPTFVITADIVQAICFGSNTASVSISVQSNGFPPYTYKWSDGPSTKDRFGIPAGNYTLTVTDSEGFVGSKVIQVGQNPEISLNGVVDDDSITLEVSGGIGPYTYLWSDGSTDKDREGLFYGQNSVTVTDSVGCSKTFDFYIDSQRFFFSGNPVVLPMQASAPETKLNLAFLCEVWVENVYLSGHFEKVAELEHPADRDGRTRFDVSVFLQPFLKAYFPPLDQNQVSLASGAFKRFYLRYAEKYGRPAIVSEFSVEDYRYVVLGGLGFEEVDRQRFFKVWLPQQQPFFTWLPEKHLITRTQPEFLFFMLHQPELNAFVVKVRSTDADGLQSTSTAYQQNNCTRFELFCIPVGAQALQIPDNSIKWEVWVEDQLGNRLSQVMLYELDIRYARYRRYFLYLNSLGGIDTLCTRGLGTVEADVQTESMQRMLLPGYDSEQGDAETVEASLQPVLEVSTGYIDDASQLRALSDFVLSRQVRLVHSGAYKAGQVRVKKFKQLDETSKVKFLDFEFVLPREHFYTPEL